MILELFSNRPIDSLSNSDCPFPFADSSIIVMIGTVFGQQKKKKGPLSH
jgi:hypothetical protein